MKLNKKILVGVTAVASTLGALQAYGATQSMTANIEIVQAIVFSSPVNLDFGQIGNNIGTGTVVIDTDGSVTGSAYMSGAAVGSVDISGGAAQIDIELNNFSNTNVTEFTLTAPTCEYNSAGSSTACGTSDGYNITPPDTGVYTLEIGMTLTGVAVTINTFTETFDVVAVYN